MFSSQPVAAAPPLPSRAHLRTRRSGGGPRRFSALWPELRVRLMEARRGATSHPDDGPRTAPRAYAGGGDA